MWAYAVVVAMASLVALIVTRSEADASAVDKARSFALAESMAVYRAAVVEMAGTRPSFEGPVHEADIALPAWWMSRPELHAVVEERMVAIYVVPDKPHSDLLSQMQALSANSLLVGVADRQSGTLHTPAVGDTGISMPSAVPDGALVWMAMRD